MQNKISIIVPIYNVEKCVDKCIKSIVEQTYKNLEIILVDDGSTDNSGALCDEWAEKDDRIIVIHKENEGLSDARNSGLKISTGKYVGFIDGDDWIEPDMYDYLYQLLTDNDADISVCEHYIAYDSEQLEAGGALSSDINVYDRKNALWELIQDETIHSFAWDKLYKADLFENIAYPTRRYVQDMFTTYKLFEKCNKIVFGHEPKYYYYQRKNSIQKTRGEKLDWDQFCAYKDWSENIARVYPEWEQYLLVKWIAFTVSAYNSMLLREEIGVDTLTRKNKMRDTIENNYKRIDFMKNIILRVRIMFIRCKKYEQIYPILKKSIMADCNKEE